MEQPDRLGKKIRLQMENVSHSIKKYLTISVGDLSQRNTLAARAIGSRTQK